MQEETYITREHKLLTSICLLLFFFSFFLNVKKIRIWRVIAIEQHCTVFVTFYYQKQNALSSFPKIN